MYLHLYIIDGIVCTLHGTLRLFRMDPCMCLLFEHKKDKVVVISLFFLADACLSIVRIVTCNGPTPCHESSSWMSLLFTDDKIVMIRWSYETDAPTSRSCLLRFISCFDRYSCSTRIACLLSESHSSLICALDVTNSKRMEPLYPGGRLFWEMYLSCDEWTPKSTRGVDSSFEFQFQLQIFIKKIEITSSWHDVHRYELKNKKVILSTQSSTQSYNG